MPLLEPAEEDEPEEVLFSVAQPASSREDAASEPIAVRKCLRVIFGCDMRALFRFVLVCRFLNYIMRTPV